MAHSPGDACTTSTGPVHAQGLLQQYRAGGLPAFDTVLYRLAKDSPESVYIAPAPLARQAKHALVGRR